jgi:hypothetical protein
MRIQEFAAAAFQNEMTTHLASQRMDKFFQLYLVLTVGRRLR